MATHGAESSIESASATASAAIKAEQGDKSPHTVLEDEHLINNLVEGLDKTDESTSSIKAPDSLVDPTLSHSPLGQVLLGQKFIILGTSSAASEIQNIIEELGGVVVGEDNTQGIYLAQSVSDVGLSVNVPVYSFDFVYAAQRDRVLPDLNEFKIRRPPQLPQNLDINIGDLAKVGLAKAEDDVGSTIDAAVTSLSMSPASAQKKRSMKFTKAEDEAILDLIRRNPNLRSTHSFFARIAQLPLLSGHTGNSIRFRFRKILSDKLEYVYQVDPQTNKLVLDPQTNEPIKVKDLPNLLKSQYTAEEDYELCKHILHFKENMDQYAKKRKLDGNSIPESVFTELVGKFPRHSAMSWRDRYRKFASKYGLEEYIKYYEECVAKNVSPQPMKNLSSRAKEAKEAKRIKLDEKNDLVPSLDRIEALARVSVERKETEENAAKKEDSPEPKSEKDKRAEDEAASANLFEDANEDEIKALDDDLSKFDALPPLEGENNFLFEELKKEEPEPLKNKSLINVDETCVQIEQIFATFGSTITTSFDLFKVLNEKVGLSMGWLNYWFDCSCGRLDLFMEAILNYIRNDELILNNYAGFWTSDHDKMLREKDQLPELIKLHGSDSVAKRKEALYGN
ncbi:hypothetical protein OGAPHI_000317 [Ogataea philodendri]|uniref:DNA-binding protein RAP1 n=1 Tax=Ogataea philodendri TaxID=1378263 RepID=A0A9P8TAH4_9ASCO|nr:uncharacterized protein OGAPHI_000317 [Ogataea philodendri]KAH3671614.1 hypothetical protein OGAPHI_000317 [Ogataea philodendri]